MRQQLFLIGVVSVFGINAAMAEEQLGSEAADIIVSSHYICERNVHVPVVYINTAGGLSYAIVDVEGKQVAMRQHPGASGAHYIAVDEQDSYRWYTKGDEAFLAWLAADHTAEEQTILSGCKVVDD